MQLSSPSVKMREVLLFFVINFKYLKYPVLHVAFLRIHSLFCHIVQLLLHSRHKIRIRGLFKVAGADQAVEIFHAGINIVIDYDKPTDEDGEQYQAYFLNMVDEADLLAAMQAAGGELPECSCADKCAVGAINTDCIVCAVNMGECQGKAPEPAPVEEPEPDPEPEQPKSSGGTLLLVLAVAVIGGGAGWYFKIYRPKKQQAADAAEDYGDDYDDTPPWEDEDETESEGEE